jgi:hypothetical protein
MKQLRCDSIGWVRVAADMTKNILVFDAEEHRQAGGLAKIAALPATSAPIQ